MSLEFLSFFKKSAQKHQKSAACGLEAYNSHLWQQQFTVTDFKDPGGCLLSCSVKGITIKHNYQLKKNYQKNKKLVNPHGSPLKSEQWMLNILLFYHMSVPVRKLQPAPLHSAALCLLISPVHLTCCQLFRYQESENSHLVLWIAVGKKAFIHKNTSWQ